MRKSAERAPETTASRPKCERWTAYIQCPTMRVRFEAVLALAASCAAVGAAIVAGFVVASASDAHVKPLHNGWFLTGCFLIVLGIALPASRVLVPRDVDRLHRQGLAVDLDHLLGAVREGHVVELSRQLRAHFPRLIRQVSNWNTVLSHWEDAQRGLAARFALELNCRNLEGSPYRRNLIPKGLVELSMSELLPEDFFSGRASVALELVSWWSFSEAAGAPAEGKAR